MVHHEDEPQPLRDASSARSSPSDPNSAGELVDAPDELSADLMEEEMEDTSRDDWQSIFWSRSAVGQQLPSSRADMSDNDNGNGHRNNTNTNNGQERSITSQSFNDILALVSWAIAIREDMTGDASRQNSATRTAQEMGSGAASTHTAADRLSLVVPSSREGINSDLSTRIPSPLPILTGPIYRGSGPHMYLGTMQEILDRTVSIIPTSEPMELPALLTSELGGILMPLPGQTFPLILTEGSLMDRMEMAMDRCRNPSGTIVLLDTDVGWPFWWEHSERKLPSLINDEQSQLEFVQEMNDNGRHLEPYSEYTQMVENDRYFAQIGRRRNPMDSHQIFVRQGVSLELQGVFHPDPEQRARERRLRTRMRRSLRRDIFGHPEQEDLYNAHQRSMIATRLDEIVEGMMMLRNNPTRSRTHVLLNLALLRRNLFVSPGVDHPLNRAIEARSRQLEYGVQHDHRISLNEVDGQEQDCPGETNRNPGASAEVGDEDVDDDSFLSDQDGDRRTSVDHNDSEEFDSQTMSQGMVYENATLHGTRQMRVVTTVRQRVYMVGMRVSGNGERLVRVVALRDHLPRRLPREIAGSSRKYMPTNVPDTRQTSRERESTLRDKSLNRSVQSVIDRQKWYRMSLSPVPSFIYREYDFNYLVGELMNYLRESPSFDAQSLRDMPLEHPTTLSYWLARHVRMNDRERMYFLLLGEPVQRLRFLLNLAKEAEAYFHRCDNVIALHKDVFTMTQEGPQNVFVNSGGVIHSTITFRDAQNLLFSGEAVSEHSWFPGYAWTIAECRQCREHIGWLFTPARSDLPANWPHQFYGLRADVLIPKKRL
eukprot:Clim_evm14s226 gene=Clim_evmTU14s226